MTEGPNINFLLDRGIGPLAARICQAVLSRSGDSLVLAKLKTGMIVVTSLGVFAVLAPPSALAITAEVAKKCSALTAKAFPPRVVGNPAAGLQSGSYQDFRNYFNKCVANGGNPPEQENQNNTQTPPKDNNGQAPKQNK
jgi:hypothetical protein